MIQMHFIRTLLLTLLGLASFQSMATDAEDIKGFTLKNGMEFLVLEDHSIPNANMYLFWKVGSRNEYPGITGLSHFFEHMMFNGAKKYGPKQFDLTMEGNGGGNNAYTSENLTVYTDWFPSRAMEVIFELEADRIMDLAIVPKMVESERAVVASERRTRMENSNHSILQEEVKGIAFRAHPYSWNVIGHESDIANWKQEDLEQYFRTYYAPNNALVVMVGDLNVEQVKKLAQTYFEKIPGSKPPRAIHTIEPDQRGERRLFVTKASTSAPAILIGYKVPATKHEDTFALDILGTVLANGSSSRLFRRLVDEEQLATDIFFYMPDSFDPNLFYLYVEANPDSSTDEIEKVIYQEIQKVSKGGLTNQELQKVKNKKTIDFYRSMETIDDKADTIGTYHLFYGGYKTLFATPENYGAVTLDDVARVAGQYLKKANRTVGVLGAVEAGDEL
jgi:predicted Zn-dependent peptidase